MHKVDNFQNCQSIDSKDWVCCMDCGLLIEPRQDGQKRWTICRLCAEVYKKTNHPWLAKMLATHVSAMIQSPPARANKKYNVYLCTHCGGYFVNIQKSKILNMCHWCQLIMGRKPQKTHVARCIVCHKVITIKKGLRQLVCAECIPELENIRKALRYTYYIMERTKKLELRIKNANCSPKDKTCKK